MNEKETITMPTIKIVKLIADNLMITAENAALKKVIKDMAASLGTIQTYIADKCADDFIEWMKTHTPVLDEDEEQKKDEDGKDASSADKPASDETETKKD